MRRTLLVAWHEWRALIWRKRFLFSLLSLPGILLFGIGLGIVTEKLMESDLPIGYVDQAGFLDPNLPIPLEKQEDPFVLTPYPDEASAQAALDAKHIQAYFVISADYPQSRAVKLVYARRPNQQALRYFTRWLQVNHLKDFSPQVRERLLLKTSTDVHILENERVFPNGEPDIGLFIPLIFAFLFMMLILMSVNYFMTAMTKEKESRMSEILLTILRPSEFIVGKVLGIIGMSLVQGLVWGSMGLLAWFILSRIFPIPALMHPTIDWAFLLSLLLLALILYLSFAIAVLLLGIIMPDVEHGQQIGGLFSLLWALPLWLIVPIVEHPDSVLALALSFIPGAALTTLALRSLATSIPAWQIGASMLINTGFAALLLFITVKTFRLGMLLYGKRLRWRDIWQALRVKE